MSDDTNATFTYDDWTALGVAAHHFFAAVHRAHAAARDRGASETTALACDRAINAFIGAFARKCGVDPASIAMWLERGDEPGALDLATRMQRLISKATQEPHGNE